MKTTIAGGLRSLSRLVVAHRLWRRRLEGNTLLAGSATYLLSNIANAAVPFALLPVLTRCLGPTAYGEVAMFQTLLHALEAFVGLSVAGAAGRKYFDGTLHEQDMRHFIAACLQIVLMTGGIAFAFMAVFGAPLSEWLGLAPRWLLLAVVVSTGTVVTNLRLGQWQIRKQARPFGVLQVSQSVLNMALSLLLVVVFLKGADGRIAAQGGAVVVFAMLSLVLLHRSRLLAFRVWKPAYMREALAFGVPLVPHFIGIFLLGSVDRFVVNAELGLAEAGVYMVAVQLANSMGLVFDALNKAYGPWLFERLQRDRPEEKCRIVRYTYVWFGVLLAAAGMTCVMGPWLVPLIAGDRYAHAGTVIGWLAFGQAFNGMYFMVTNYIFYSKRTGALSLATIVSGSINVVLLIVLVRHWGLEGAAIAFSVTMAFRFLLTWWVAHRRHPMPWFAFKVVG